MGNSRPSRAPSKKPAVKKTVTSGKDKALMSVIRDCSKHPWCGYSMTVTDKVISYQRPTTDVSFSDLFNEQINPSAVCENVEVKL